MRRATVAAIDCGTNSTRLIVVAADHTVLDRQMHVTRLGQGVDAVGALDPEAIERSLAVLRRYRHRMDELDVEALRMVATSAARDACNAEEFFAAATDIVGVRPELLTGEEEGRLSFAGATAHLPDGFATGAPVLTVDIGGGSTELAAGVPAIPETVRALSLDIGCVRVTERFLNHDPPTQSELSEAEEFVRTQLDGARPLAQGLASGGPVIGLAGTVSTLSALENQVAQYSRQALHHSVLSNAAVERWLRTLAAEAASARLQRPGMIEGRADVIVGGVLVLDSVMKVFERAWCLVSEDDILDGLAASVVRS